MLGFGGAEIGFQPIEQSEVDKMLNSALDNGLNVIDTAAAYLKSEQLIGKAVSHRRKEFHLLTKCGALDAFTREDWSKKGVLQTIEDSLRNLKTDYLDIAQLHSCSKEILRQADCIEGLIRAQERGYTRYVGYSGDNEAAKYALELDFFDSLQISVSIADQYAIEKIIPSAVEKGVGVIAKRPIANAVWRFAEKPSEAYHYEYWERVRKLNYKFLQKTPEEAAATALRFTMTVPGITTMIVGTTRPERILENARYVAEGNLSEEEFEEIRNRWREVANENWIGQT